jgi:hemolysin activation/secretion protein
MATKPSCLARRAAELLWAPALALGMTAVASAQTADPQRVEERLPDQPKGESPVVAPVPVDDSDLAAIRPFTLTSVALEGVTAVDTKAAHACTGGLIGQQVGAAGLVGLTDCITKLYREQGYFLSRVIIPQQNVLNGALKLRAIEGYVAAIDVTGLDTIGAESQFASTLEERPARLSTFERNLLLLSDRYGHRVTSSKLAVDPNDPARFTLKLAVEVKPVTWRIFGDNRGDARQGPEQALLSVAWNAPFGAEDRVSGQVFTAPANTGELFFAEFGYGRAWFDGLFWTEFGISTSNSDDGSAFPEFGSETDRAYARVNIPVVRSRRNSLWAKLQLDGRDVDTFDIAANETHERTHVLRGSLSYTLVDGGTRSDITLEGSRGLDGLRASVNGDADLSRPDSRPQFTKARLDASLSQRLLSRLDVVAQLSGQWADGALPASEEFGAGGSRFGRAYDYSEILGDSAIAGSIELRWTWRKLNDWLTSLQLYAFADAARVWDTAFDSESLSSVGGGLRVSLAPGLNATLEVAKPLSRDVASQNDRSPRMFVSIAAGW